MKRRFNEVIKELVRGISAEKWNTEIVKKEIKSFNKNSQPIILVSYHTPDFPTKYKDYDNLWIVFDKLVEVEIKNLLYNAVYAGELFPDPRNPTDLTTLANMWIWIEYLPENVALHFTNKLTDNFDIVKENIVKGYNDAHRHCTFEKALNGSSEICTNRINNEEFITVILSLPIV